MAVAVALTLGACAGSDPQLAPIQTPAGSELPYGPAAEDAIAHYVEIVLGHPFVGECPGAGATDFDRPADVWCYQRGVDNRVGPVGEPAQFVLRLSESSEGWRVDDQLAIEP